MNIKQIVLDLCAMNDEQEWFEFMKKAQPKQWERYTKRIMERMKAFSKLFEDKSFYVFMQVSITKEAYRDLRGR